MLSLSRTRAKEMPQGAEFAHLLVNERGKIIFANRFFVDLAQSITHKRMSVRDTIGKTVNQVFGKETGNTFVGTFLKKRSPTSGEFMIGNQLYQVVVEEVVEEKETYYEFFYLPIKTNDNSTKGYFFQNMVYELATKKGFVNVDWIKDISDSHGKQLISCLLKHEHTTNPEGYCPYKHRCGFNPNYGLSQIDRRSYYRTKVNFAGELYLKMLKDRPVPPQLVTKKIPCQALDLSMEGIKLQLKNICLPEGSLVRLVFEEFTAEGTVIWTSSLGEDWLTGIKFSKLEA